MCFLLVLGTELGLMNANEVLFLTYVSLLSEWHKGFKNCLMIYMKNKMYPLHFTLTTYLWFHLL